MKRILVTGAMGQIGAELVPALRARYGADAVVASDVRVPPQGGRYEEGPYEHVDCTRMREIDHAVRRYDVDAIYHLAALLSAVAEEQPRSAWKVNMGGLSRALEVARVHRCSFFFPSSIGAFGRDTPSPATPQVTIQRPSTMYGVTKVSGELLCDYYHRRFGVDTRGIRLPGLISHVATPGGGTTDWAVEIFYHAIEFGRYACFLRSDNRQPLMYMPDAIRGMIELMEADPTGLVHRNAFNIAALSATPQELASEIRKWIPEFVLETRIDPLRQAIADTWPVSIDDSAARAEWGWAPSYDLASMTRDMLAHLSPRLASK